ncbi:MAG: hypothetical protein AB8B77_01000 [Alphaproteobacteria bacterium]
MLDTEIDTESTEQPLESSTAANDVEAPQQEQSDQNIEQTSANPFDHRETRENHAHLQTDQHRLEAEFGRDQWVQLRPQLSNWAATHLPPALMQQLSAHYDGVILIHRMMQATQEGQLLKGGDGDQMGFDESHLKQMIRNPKYWRDHDPAFRKRVEAGFKQLYPEG